MLSPWSFTSRRTSAASRVRPLRRSTTAKLSQTGSGGTSPISSSWILDTSGSSSG